MNQPMKMLQPMKIVQTFLTTLIAASCAATLAQASDFRDSAALAQASLAGSLDLGDLYVFRSPTNEENTVLIMTMSEFANVISPITFDPEANYEFLIDQNGDLLPEVTLRIVFSPPPSVRDDFSQKARVQLIRPGLPTFTMGKNIPTNSDEPADLQLGGIFAAGIFDDPAFFDLTAFLDHAQGAGSFPRATPKNYFGPNANCLAIVLEVPSSRLTAKDHRPVIRVWARVTRKGRQVDRVGAPFTSLFFIPTPPTGEKLPRDRHNEFNLGRPNRDSKSFRNSAIDVLEDFWEIPANRAGALVDDLFLPDVLKFDTSLEYFKTSKFPNGRGLRDDVADDVLKLISGKAEDTDGVSDDNGNKIKDGQAMTTAEFPYLGEANNPPAGPPVEP